MQIQIRRLVRSFLAHRIDKESITLRMEKMFGDVVRTPKLFLENIFLTPPLFESWIWRIIQDHIFSTDSVIWAGQPGKHFAKGFRLVEGE